MRLQLISRCSIRKDAERTKGENRQEAKHGQIFPRPRLITAQRWASSLGSPLRQQPAHSPPAGFPVYAGQNTLAAVDGKATATKANQISESWMISSPFRKCRIADGWSGWLKVKGK